MTNRIESMEALRALYDAPKDISVKKQLVKLDQHAIRFIELSGFALLATSDAKGRIDCSPRGDHPGFIQVLDEGRIALPDRPGNNRLDSLGNIVENPNVGLLLLIPGFKESLRINGQAHISIQQDLLERFEYHGKLPKSVIVIETSEVYFHCAKALARSKLWEPESRVDRNAMPSLGKILMNQIKPDASSGEIETLDSEIEQRVKTGLY